MKQSAHIQTVKKQLQFP
jgi:predicted RNase H-like nuclease